MYYYLLIFVHVLSYIPISASRFLGKFVGIILFRVPTRRKRIAMCNMQKTFGSSMGKGDIGRLNRQVYIHFGQMFFEVPHILKMKTENLNKYVNFKGEEYLIQALKKGKGVLMLTGHFGIFFWC